MRRRRAIALPLLIGLLASALVAGTAMAAGPVTVVATGLHNPRGIDVGSTGRIFVAEAGSGGSANGYGRSGRIAVIVRGHVRTFAGHLPSAISPEGEVTGPVNVGVRGDGTALAVIGGGPQVVDKRFDSVLRLSPRHGRRIADIQAFRNAHPDTTDLDQPPNPTDSNGYGLALLRGGRSLVTDAAGNDLLLIGPRGHIVTVAKFPNQVISTSHLPPGIVPPGVTALPAEAVPTSVAVGPDGYWYVGELKGFPFTPGTSRIWRIAPWARNVTCDSLATTGPCRLYMDGFTSITGLDFGPNGAMYVVEIAKAGVGSLFFGGDDTGALIRVRHGVRTELAPGALHAPGDVAVSARGRIYVTNKSTSVDQGEVLRIHP